VTDSQRFTIRQHDEFERIGGWALARRSLCLTAFGMNVVDIELGATIPAHDEVPRDQEEVAIVLSDSPAMVIDGEEHVARPAPRPRLTRARAHRRQPRDEPARALIVSAPRTSGEPMGWA